MREYFWNFSKIMWIKAHPSEYELFLFEKTKKYSKYISWIPWLKMIAVCNSLSMYATKEYENSPKKNLKSLNYFWNQEKAFAQVMKEKWWSDIDLFIITAHNRMWFVRLMVTLIFQILGVRRHWNKINSRFCLSFFISENAMNFSTFAIEDDIYLYFWIYYLKPIINKDHTYESFIKSNKSLWINELNLHWDNKVYIMKTKDYNKWLDENRFLDYIDKFLKYIFLPITLKHKKRLWDPYGIIVSDDILKFHDNDRRVEIRKELRGY